MQPLDQPLVKTEVVRLRSNITKLDWKSKECITKITKILLHQQSSRYFRRFATIKGKSGDRILGRDDIIGMYPA